LQGWHYGKRALLIRPKFQLVCTKERLTSEREVEFYHRRASEQWWLSLNAGTGNGEWGMGNGE